MGLYGYLRSLNRGKRWYNTVLNSSIAGMTLWTVMFPLDTIKIEIQTRQDVGVNRVRDILARRYSEYGMSCGLWRGITPI